MKEWPRICLDSRDPAARWNCRPGGAAALVLECDALSHIATLRDARGAVARTWEDPLAALAWMARHLEALDLSDARWIGFLSYDLGRLFERLPSRAVDDLRLPLFAFALYENAAAGSTARAPARERDAGQARRTAHGLTSSFSRNAYVAAVGRTIDYIAAGDVFQVNLSQRFTAPLSEDSARVYARLERQSPALFGGHLDFGDYALLCNSPELFLRVERGPAEGSASSGRRVITRPIKGTRPRTVGMELELRDSAKDQAELNMIVDLERNDLGRVCTIGSVRVSQPRTIEAHPTVYHGAATIEGMLREDITFVDLLRATFPGGSITGAPKIRAMEIIDALEPTRRGPYCGAIGFLAPGGVVELNIAIRTMIVKDGLVHIPVGGGIVADSDPAAEYEETLVKARAMFAALNIVAPAP